MLNKLYKIHKLCFALNFFLQPVKSEPPHQSSPAVEPIDMTKQEKEKLERKQMRNRIAALVFIFFSTY